MKNNCINYIEFPVKNIEKSKTFFGNAFGWTFTDYGPDYSSFSDGVLDGGFRKESHINIGGALVILYHDNLELIMENIKNAGGKISVAIFEFPGGRRFHFTDPDGHELAVWSDK